MPILDIQQRLRELGRIRIGTRTTTKGGKKVPKKLETFRFTSASLDLVAGVAELYGGTPQPWKDAPTDGDQFEVYSSAQEINIVLPPLEVLEQWMELWSGGGCQRRCDSRTEFLSMRPCLCPADPTDRAELAANGEACKPTTRLRVMLPEVPGVGVWRLETHGYYAAAELAGVAQLLAAATAQGVALPAKLRLEQRTRKSPGQPTRKFAVPVIDVHAPIGAVLESAGALAEPLEQAPAPLPGRRGTQREPLPAGPQLAPPARGGPDEPSLPESPPPQAKSGEQVELPTVPPPPPPQGFEPTEDVVAPDDTQQRSGSNPRAAGAASPRGAQPPVPPPANGKPISDAQVKAIHTLAGRAGLIDGSNADAYRQALQDRYGKTSSKDLTSEEASDFIDALQKRGTPDAR